NPITTEEFDILSGGVGVTAGRNLTVDATNPAKFSLGFSPPSNGAIVSLIAGGAGVEGVLSINGSLIANGPDRGNLPTGGTGGSITLASNSILPFVIGSNASGNGITGTLGQPILSANGGPSGGDGGTVRVSNSGSGGVSLTPAALITANGGAGVVTT